MKTGVKHQIINGVAQIHINSVHSSKKYKHKWNKFDMTDTKRKPNTVKNSLILSV